MLTIQPVSVNQVYSRKPAFKGYDNDAIKDDKKFMEDQVRELDEIINDSYVPEGIKKPFKFFRVLGTAALEGIAVFGSVVMLAGQAKKIGARINKSKVTQKVAKPLGSKILSGLQYIASKIGAGVKFLKGTKLGQKAVKQYRKFAQTKVGKAIIGFTKAAYRKSADFIKNMLKKLDGDKVTKGTAATLGVGSGISGAYEEAVKNDEAKTSEEEFLEGDED